MRRREETITALSIPQIFSFVTPNFWGFWGRVIICLMVQVTFEQFFCDFYHYPWPGFYYMMSTSRVFFTRRHPRLSFYYDSDFGNPCINVGHLISGMPNFLIRKSVHSRWKANSSFR
ncbi:MAG: hypothetical protein DPW09_10800 [Anaerolineae bacterium]|nr:hypothetical protein [Anaerolineae bacterium]